MIAYPHFALPNIYLLNGYEEVQTPYGLAYKYEREDDLEQCIRKVLLRKPEPLRGWDLRFLRRGLNLSQSEFGRMVDRDAQTVARWEKRNESVPKFVDITIRARFGAHFEPRMSLRELFSYVDGTALPLPQRILFTLSASGWRFVEEARTLYLTKQTHASASVVMPSAPGPVYTVIEKRTKHSPALLFDKDSTAESAFQAFHNLLQVSFDKISNPQPVLGIPDFDFLPQGLSYEHAATSTTKH